MDKTLDELFQKINITITDLAKECKKPNFEKMQILTKTFKKQIRKSKNHVKKQLENPDNLVPLQLQEYSEFINGLLGAIDHVCSDSYCPQYKKTDNAYREICQDLKHILNIEVINELNVLLPLSKISNKNYKKPSLIGGRKTTRKKPRVKNHALKVKSIIMRNRNSTRRRRRKRKTK